MSGLALVAISGIVALAAAPSSAASSSAQPCTRDSVPALIRSFVGAYNRGDTDDLDRIWAQEPYFEWYSVEDERTDVDAHNRLTLMSYFQNRHELRDRVELVSLRVSPRDSDDGTFDFAFRLERKSQERPARGTYHGKGAAVDAVTVPDPYYPTEASTCVLHVWSMGKER